MKAAGHIFACRAEDLPLFGGGEDVHADQAFEVKHVVDLHLMFAVDAVGDIKSETMCHTGAAIVACKDDADAVGIRYVVS